MDQSHAAFRRSRHFLSLDGLRGLSIATVIWHHAGGANTFERFHGVDMFFEISGFLITTILLRERDQYGQISLRRFYTNRVLRTFPIYYAMLAVYIVLVAATRSDEPAGRQFFNNLPYFLTHSSNWFVRIAPGVIFSFAWSLSTQEQFYALWPLAIRLSRPRWNVVALIALASVIVMLNANLLNAVFPPRSTSRYLLNHVPLPIVVGAICAYAAHSSSSHRWLNQLVGGRWALVALISLLLVAPELQLPRGVVVVLLALIVVSTVMREDHAALSPILTNAALRQAGVVSLGMYLMHGLVYNMVQAAEARLNIHQRFVTYVVVLGITYGLARLSYTFYESRILRHKIRSGPKPSPSAAIAEPTTVSTTLAS